MIIWPLGSTRASSAVGAIKHTSNTAIPQPNISSTNGFETPKLFFKKVEQFDLYRYWEPSIHCGDVSFASTAIPVSPPTSTPN